MSHDCDCDDCQQHDSRWAAHRASERAKMEDCPKGKHVQDLIRCTVGEPESAEYQCKHCKLRLGFAIEPRPANDTPEVLEEIRAMELTFMPIEDIGMIDDEWIALHKVQLEQFNNKWAPTNPHEWAAWLSFEIAMNHGWTQGES